MWFPFTISDVLKGERGRSLEIEAINRIRSAERNGRLIFEAVDFREKRKMQLRIKLSFP